MKYANNFIYANSFTPAPARKATIRWTSGQTEQVVDKIVELLLKDHPEVDLSKTKEGLVDSALITHLMYEAQPVLGQDFKKASFSSTLHHNTVRDVSYKLRQAQIKLGAKNVVLGGMPTEVLLSELANRLTNTVAEYVMAKMRKDIMDQALRATQEIANATIAQELGGWRERLKHNPLGIADPKTKTVRELPTYTVVGLLGDQEQNLAHEFYGRCNFEFVRAEEAFKVKEAARGRIAFCTRFINDSLYKAVKKSAAHAVLVNGGATDMKRMIEVQINEFEALQTKQGG